MSFAWKAPLFFCHGCQLSTRIACSLICAPLVKVLIVSRDRFPGMSSCWRDSPTFSSGRSHRAFVFRRERNFFCLDMSSAFCFCVLEHDQNSRNGGSGLFHVDGLQLSLWFCTWLLALTLPSLTRLDPTRATADARSDKCSVLLCLEPSALSGVRRSFGISW